MTRFLDGPAEHSTLLLKRAPLFLRAVRKRAHSPIAPLCWDALDLVEDQPADDEEIVVYRRVSEPTYVHINARKGGGVFRGGDYRIVSPAPLDADVRTSRAWQDWTSRNQ